MPDRLDTERYNESSSLTGSITKYHQKLIDLKGLNESAVVGSGDEVESVMQRDDTSENQSIAPQNLRRNRYSAHQRLVEPL
jgi:hypothetical protein